MIGSERINLTLGSLTTPQLTLYKFIKGKWLPAVESARMSLDVFCCYTKFNCRYKIIIQGRNEKEDFTQKLVRMLRNEEIDASVFPISYDISNPPGQFLFPSREEKFNIISFPHEPHITQSVEQGILTLHRDCWIMIFLLTLFIEIMIVSNNFRSKILSSLCKAFTSIPNVLFFQYIKEKSFLRTVQVTGVMMFTMILSAAFSTSKIIGDSEPLINTLQDIVDRDKTPFFMEGQSALDRFVNSPTHDFAAVYQHALKKVESKKVSKILFGPVISEMLPEVNYDSAILQSELFQKLTEIIFKNSGIKLAEHFYFSNKPYHRSMQATLVNPQVHREYIINELNMMSSLWAQAGLNLKNARQAATDLMTLIGFSLSDIHRISYRAEGFSFFAEELRLQGFNNIKQIYIKILLVVFTLFIVELVFSKS